LLGVEGLLGGAETGVWAVEITLRKSKTGK